MLHPEHAQKIFKSEYQVGPIQVRSTLMAWVAFAGFGLWIYHEIAQKAFSAILTLSVMAQTLSFALLLLQIYGSRSVAGISGQALVMHVAKLICRLGVTVFVDAYLPVDRSGDWIYQAADTLSLLLVIAAVVYIHGSHNGSYQASEDTMEVRNLMLGAFLLAVLIHPSMAHWAPVDILWAAHLYIDAVAMLPQLWMLSKAGGQVKGLTAHYIAATLLSNLLSGIFWFYASPEFATQEKEAGRPGSFNIHGLTVNGAHVVQVLLLLDFGYFYCRACLQGRFSASTFELDYGAVDV